MASFSYGHLKKMEECNESYFSKQALGCRSPKPCDTELSANGKGLPLRTSQPFLSYCYLAVPILPLLEHPLSLVLPKPPRFMTHTTNLCPRKKES
jgi:hypothetical protein